MTHLEVEEIRYSGVFPVSMRALIEVEDDVVKLERTARWLESKDER